MEQKIKFLNPNVDYSKLNQATSHIGHGGTNHQKVNTVWYQVKLENQNELKIKFFGKEILLKKHTSSTGKSTYYSAILDREFIKNNIPINLAKKSDPHITISDPTTITIHNGKSYYIHICPSLIEII